MKQIIVLFLVGLSVFLAAVGISNNVPTQIAEAQSIWDPQSGAAANDPDLKEARAELAQHQLANVQIETFTGLIELINEYKEVADDPTSAGIAALFSIEDHAGSVDKAISGLEDILPDVKDPALRRAIRLKLVEFYGQKGENQKALAQIKLLITQKDI